MSRSRKENNLRRVRELKSLRKANRKLRQQMDERIRQEKLRMVSGLDEQTFLLAKALRCL